MLVGEEGYRGTDIRGYSRAHCRKTPSILFLSYNSDTFAQFGII